MPKGVYSRGDPLTRWLKYVNKTDACWIWIGDKLRLGYGRFWFAGKTRLAHRWFYEYMLGELPKHLTLDHLCRNRLCVKLTHLEPVTIRENTLRGSGAAAQNARKTHCLRDHKFSTGNTYTWKSRQRQCKICRRLRHHIRKARHRNQ
jgi:hypothetical protein